MQLGRHPNPTAPWRPLLFRVHCLVTQRWMKIRVPFAWFWYGETEYGTPEVESGTIASASPQPPAQALAHAVQRATESGPRMPVGAPPPLDAGSLPVEQLQPYQTPRHRDHTSALLTRAQQLEQEAARMRAIAEGDDGE